jgi:hypothetical protein
MVRTFGVFALWQQPRNSWAILFMLAPPNGNLHQARPGHIQKRVFGCFAGGAMFHASPVVTALRRL